MNFGEAISDGFSKYAEFNGRSSRSAFWFWTLFYVLVLIGAQIVDLVIKAPVATGLVWLGFLIPGIAIMVRRLHDIDQSGWWVLIGLIPFIGGIVLLVFACLPSKGPNQYGAGPDGKEAVAGAPYPGQTYPGQAYPPAPPAPPAPQAPPPPAPSTGDTPPPPPPPQS